MRKIQKRESSAYKYFFMLIVFAEVTTPGKAAAEAMVTVLDFAFCKKVVDLMPVEPIVNPAVLRPEKNCTFGSIFRSTPQV